MGTSNYFDRLINILLYQLDYFIQNITYLKLQYLASKMKKAYNKQNFFRGCFVMNKTPATISGYVVALPRNVDSRQSIVAIVQDGVEYRILPRGAGVDLVDEVNASVEATGLIEEDDGIYYLAVRGYKVLEDDTWPEE